MLNFIITIFVVLILGGLALIAPNRLESGKKILAAVSTAALFYALGTTVYWFLNFIMAGVIMYFYIGTENTEDVWLKIIVFVATMGLIGHWRDSNKEGFNITPLKYMSSNLTARQCQDVCEESMGCKYAQVPLGTSNSGLLHKCWISYGFNQSSSGSVSQGGDTWTNKLWRSPVIVSGSYNGTITTSGPTRVMDSKTTSMVPQEVTLKVDIKDQGWGNSTWGVYIEGSGPSGIVFKQAIQAPRSSSVTRYPKYRQQAYVSYSSRRVPYWARYYYYIKWFGFRIRKWRWGLRYKDVSFPVPRTRSVFAGYGSRTVQGPLLGRSQAWKINTTRKITSIKVYASTRGQGHALTARSVKWSVKGWPQ
jgi:hypothetical protein